MRILILKEKMMKRNIRIALALSTLILFAGCRDGNNAEMESPEIAETPATPDAATVEPVIESPESVAESSPLQSESEATETHPILKEPLVPRKFNFETEEEHPLVIDLPESAVVDVDTVQTIFKFDGNFMDMGVLDEEQDFDDIKQSAKEKTNFVKILIDEPGRLVVVREEFDEPNYKYYIKKKCGNRTYTVTPMSWQPTAEPTLEWAMKIADTLRVPAEE